MKKICFLIGLIAALICGTVSANERSSEQLVFEGQTSNIQRLNSNNGVIPNKEESYQSIMAELSKTGHSAVEAIQRANDDLHTKAVYLPERRSQIDALIAQNNIWISELSAAEESEAGFRNSNALIVAAAASYFAANEYSLALELLNHAASKPSETSTYYPLYGGVVFSSQSVIDTINASTPDLGTFQFAHSGTRCERDLFFSLHNVAWSRNNANSLSITDRYDFKKGDFTGIIETIICIMVDAHDAGEINYFNVYILADYSKVVNIGINSKVENTWNITISNNSAFKRTIAYNSTMASFGDARNWTNLTNIQAVNINAYGSASISIDENGAATHFAFSFTIGSQRHITIIEDMAVGSPHIPYEYGVVSCHYHENIQNLGKNGNNWLIKISNTANQALKLQYNNTMCFENDATNWANLTNVVTLTLSAYGDAIFEVSENWWATHIALRFLTDCQEKRFAVDELDTDGSCHIVMNTYIYHPYLIIENVGKINGSWKIKVTNPNANSISVAYNSKMCFESNARTWTGLGDIAYFPLPANSFNYCFINENWFATHITLSYVRSNGDRLITYADSLATNGSMAIYHNIV